MLEDMPVRITRGQELWVESQVKINCSVTQYKSNWTFYTGNYFNESIVFSAIAIDGLQLNIPKHGMDYGMYKVCNTVFMLAEPRFKEIKCGYLEVYPSDIDVHIVGGMDVQTGSARNVRSKLKYCLCYRTMLLFDFLHSFMVCTNFTDFRYTEC